MRGRYSEPVKDGDHVHVVIVGVARVTNPLGFTVIDPEHPHLPGIEVLTGARTVREIRHGDASDDALA